jgi:hypothetical protein
VTNARTTNDRTTSYTPDLLNHYTRRQVADPVEVRGVSASVVTPSRQNARRSF